MEFKGLLREIKAYETKFQPWEERARKIVEQYAGTKRDSSSPVQYNILWANVETLTPAVFARTPQPEVTRRFKDRDPAGRVAALYIERALEYEIQQYDNYQDSMEQAVKDRFLGGRGQAWVRYEPKFKDADVMVSEDVEERPQVIDYECAPVDYVHWKDFGHQTSRTWEECKLVWRKVYMSKADLVKRFGEEVAASVPMDRKPEMTDDKTAATVPQACVYEMWDKDAGEVIWLTKGREKELERKPDPLGLKDFFPCPKPLYASLTTDSLIPQPDFKVYEDQAHELDLICRRIDSLLTALKVVGVYDATQQSLRRLLEEGTNNTMIPVDGWSAFSEKNGLKGSVDFLPIDQVVGALQQLYIARDQIQAQIYELTGISDIIRGQSEASETATAQQIKGNYASMRLRNMQKAVARFARDILRIKAQIICQHFQPDTIALIAGVAEMEEPDDIKAQAMELLKNDPLRSFRIEITADSLTEVDEEQEKQSRVEFLTATGAFLEKAVAAAQVEPRLLPLLGEMLMFGVRGFKTGRSIEGAFDQTLQAMQQPQPEKPDPEMQKVQAQMQAKQAEMQMKREDMAYAQQMEQQKAQAMIDADHARAQADIAINQAKADADMTLAQRRAEFDMQIAQMKAEADMQIAMLLAQKKAEAAEKQAETSEE